ncbi:MAG: acyl-CoA thioesterase [Chitinophagaceae bacterium]
MNKIQIELPETFHFSASLTVRIAEVNYGGHVGNDALLSLLHEARLQFLHHHHYEEMNVGGVGLIQVDVGVQYKAELFYADHLRIWVAAGSFSNTGFDLYYKVEKVKPDSTQLAAVAKTGMACLDYTTKKIKPLPPGVAEELSRP